MRLTTTGLEVGYVFDIEGTLVFQEINARLCSEVMVSEEFYVLNYDCLLKMQRIKKMASLNFVCVYKWMLTITTDGSLPSPIARIP